MKYAVDVENVERRRVGPGAADEDIPKLQLYAPEYSEENASARREHFMTK